MELEKIEKMISLMYDGKNQIRLKTWKKNI